ncbi:MAG: hypothetical protein LBQ62_08125 [Candidatus Accumulibacter sp.]|jgi:hypothetical protein|nr:hypothetical protein [Accumulibacter sp.]
MKDHCRDSSRKSCKKYAGALLIVFVASSYILALFGLASHSKYLSIFFSLPMSFLFVQRVQKDKVGSEQVLSNIKEANQLLDRYLHENMAYRYGDRNEEIYNNKHHNFSDFDLIEVLSSPMVIILCFCMAFITFIDPIYFDVDVNDPLQLAKLFLINLFQLFFFSAAFNGIILFFRIRRNE